MRVDDLSSLAVTVIVAAMESGDERQRGVASEALDDYVDHFGELEGVLRKCMASSQSELRLKAAYAVGKLGPRAAKFVPELEALLMDDDSGVRSQAVQALARIGFAARRSLPVLRKLLDDNSGKAVPVARSAIDEIENSAATPD